MYLIFIDPSVHLFLTHFDRIFPVLPVKEGGSGRYRFAALTAQNMKFSIKDFFSTEEILIENFILLCSDFKYSFEASQKAI